MQENKFIEGLHNIIGPHPQITLGIGDDAGILRLRDGKDLIIAKDIITEGVDFIFPDDDPITVGRKALAVNISDIAAMACRPVAALIGLVVPTKSGIATASGIMQGIASLANHWNIGIIGGDTNSWNVDAGTVISVTIIGEPMPGITPITRSGAKPGDVLMVTGTLGGSRAGKQFYFTPRVAEAEFLARFGSITSMIDLSDGLAKDAGHLAAASKVMVEIEVKSLPVAAAAKDDWKSALIDGEDFELCFTCPASVAERLLREQPLAPLQISAIGTVREGSGLFLKHESGLVEPMPFSGFQHQL